MIYGARITGTGLGMPKLTVTNDDLAKIVDTNDEWIRTRTGIRERKFLDTENGQFITEISKEAAEMAIAHAGLKNTDIDLVICCNMSQETFMPNNAARVLGHLGLTSTPGIDLGAACAGFVYGLHTANAFIRSGMHKRVVVIGADSLSSVLDMKDRSTCVLFGDGAGAVVLEAVDNPDFKTDSYILGTKIYTDFDRDLNLLIAGGGARAPAHRPDLLKNNNSYVTMKGQEVFKSAVKGMLRAASELLEELEITPDQITWLVPHQANLRIIEMTAKMMGMPMERVFVNIDHWANTSAGTVPIALAEMSQQNLLKKGDLVLMDVFGGGYNYGAAVVRW